MSSGRISHVLITDVSIHFLLPVFQKPQIPLQLCLLQSCLLEVCCLCDCFTLLVSLLTSLWFWGCCSGAMGAGTHCTLGCLQCWDVLPAPLPKNSKFHLSITPPPFPFPHPSLLAAPRTPKAPLTVLDCSCTGRALSVPYICCQLLSINIYRFFFF